MSDASLSKNGFENPPARQQTPRKGLFKLLIEALHHSRRIHARHALRQYRHLIDATASHRPSFDD